MIICMMSFECLIDCCIMLCFVCLQDDITKKYNMKQVNVVLFSSVRGKKYNFYNFSCHRKQHPMAKLFLYCIIFCSMLLALNLYKHARSHYTSEFSFFVFFWLCRGFIITITAAYNVYII